jgi:hypothetical protein
MGKLTAGLISVGLLFVLFSFVYAIHEIIPSETQIPLPGADAQKLGDYIVRYNPYTTWDLWPGKGRLFQGRDPHGSLLTTFVNYSAHYSAKNKEPMTDGAIIAKENYTADKKFVALTVMYKITGYNPEAGDWFWAKYGPDGRAQVSGKVKACIDCHAVRKDNDYIFSGSSSK